MIIQNTPQLLSHGNVSVRTTILDILEAGLQATDPYENTKKMIRINDGHLIVGHEAFSRLHGQAPLVFDLSDVGNIYVVGGGKAAQRMAKAMEDVLWSLITAGHINAKKGEPHWCTRIEVTFAGHPIPDAASVTGSQWILEIEHKAKLGDLVFLSESGGGTALMTLPAPGITLQDLQGLNRILYFEHGASKPDINAVRNQLVLLRGRHAET